MIIASPLFLFALALGLRLGFLAYNLSWHLPEVWPAVARQSLVEAESLLGKALSYSDFPNAASLELFRFDDRGLTVLHLIFYKLFGQSSVLHAQVFNILLDSTLVFPAIYLGRALGGKRFGILLGCAYALYIPQIFTSVQPVWYSPLNAGNYCLLALAVYLFQKEKWETKQFCLFSATVLAISLLVSQFRSTIIFFPIFLGLLSLVLYRGRKTLLTACFLLGGLGAVFGSALLNARYSGIATPTRSNLGHCFWVGVGEFNNPYGVTELDASVGNFYNANSGKTLSLYDTASHQDYEKWLKGKAVEFVTQHPVLYGSMVIRRGLKIVFPNYRLQRVADEESYLHNVKGSVADRMAITKSGKLFSFAGVRQLWAMDPAFFLELILRAFFFFALPIGAGIAIWKLRSNPLLPIYASGLIYGLATIAPLRGPVMNHFSIWSMTLPLVAWGWFSLWERRTSGRNEGRSLA